jgi:hypothetical protein
MTRDPIIHAIEEGIPFRISLGKTTAVVVDEKDCPHLLPLRTMTGISYVNGARS